MGLSEPVDGVRTAWHHVAKVLRVPTLKGLPKPRPGQRLKLAVGVVQFDHARERSTAMDPKTFDRITRLLGHVTSRRTGILTTIAGLAAAGTLNLEAEAARKAGRRHEKLACRNVGSQCTTGDQCCSGKCVAKETVAGTTYRCGSNRKKHGKKKGGGGGGKPVPGGIPTGEPCVAGSDVCADAAASCVDYTTGSGGPSGTYCLLPYLNDTCTAALQCACNSCYQGTCLTCECSECPADTLCDSPMVCASGCSYSTVQAAIDAITGTGTVTIGPGTYTEDIAFSGKNVMLQGCPSSTENVILTNASYGQRTITVTASSNDHNVVVNDIVLLGYSDDKAGQSGYGGGIKVNGVNLCVGMRTEILGGYQEEGGAIRFGQGEDNTNRRILTIADSVRIHGNEADSYGGGVFADSYTATVISDDASIYENSVASYGGGVAIYYGATLEVRGDAVIRNNSAGDSGGGIMLYGGGQPSSGGTERTIHVHENASIKSNTADQLGGGIAVLYAEGNESVYLDDHALVTLNTTAKGGGVYIGGTDRLNILGDATISSNSATAEGGGVYHKREVYQSASASMKLEDRAAVKDNTASQGAGFYLFSSMEITLSDEATIKDNTAANEGGGIFFYTDPNTLTLSGTSSITGNSASGGGGVWVDAQNPLTGTGYTSSGISGNTPDQCQDMSGACSF